MSTRANVIIKDAYDTLWFYRHSDGYPEGTLPTLEKFLAYVKAGKIRDNANQAAGWLIALGREEYHENRSVDSQLSGKDGLGGMGWKVGAYEPTIGQHADIEYLYTIDLTKKTLTHKHVLISI